MRSPRIVALAVLLFTMLVSGLAEAHECETSCSDYCRDQVARWQQYIDANADYCGGGETECIPNCTSRYADGSCRAYGADFCARNPVCAQRCASRYSDASCRTFDADYCAEAPATCVANCTARYADASCRTYGADVCGRRPVCRENCISRYSDGSCREYGPDVCSAGGT